jgi:peptidoglycan biosynthesis protein MviN/MurJ (putative lipid II flippase)
MMDMLIGLGVGVLLGGFAGVLVMALCFMAREGDDDA